MPNTVAGVTFDGPSRTITIGPTVTQITVGAVYSAWKFWVHSEGLAGANTKWLPAMRYTGNDPIPGGFTGATFFVINGWRIILNPSITALNGVLFSEDFATAYWTGDVVPLPIYPITVSAVVNQVTSVQNVVTGTALTQEETAAAIWNAENRSLTSEVQIPAVPTALEISAAVREALLVELARIDATISSRLATGQTVTANVVSIKNQQVTGEGTAESPWRPV